jgi:hypothetical protein
LIFLLYFISFFLFLEFLGTLQIWTTCTWNHIIWRFKNHIHDIWCILRPSSNSHEMSSTLLSWQNKQLTGKVVLNYRKSELSSKTRNLLGHRVIKCRGCVQQLGRFRASCDLWCLKPRHLHMWSNSLTNQLGIHLILAKWENMASNSLANQLGKNRNLAKLTSPRAYMNGRIVVAICVFL